jgi:hypothetical protein
MVTVERNPVLNGGLSVLNRCGRLTAHPRRRAKDATDSTFHVGKVRMKPRPITRSSRDRPGSTKRRLSAGADGGDWTLPEVSVAGR